MRLNNEDKEVRYCVTGMIDLRGFSSHLEIAGDLRTSIGQEAIKRLELLDHAIGIIINEITLSQSEYPKIFHHTRINDAVIFSLDLPDFLKPGVGEPVRNGIAAVEIEKFFDVDMSEDEFDDAYRAKLIDDVKELVLFVGMLARLHTFINKKENAAHFPGARTVIASGYRRTFMSQRTEDFLSANFSFSNVYLADRELHGPNFYVDNNIVQLLSANQYARNILRFACYVSKAAQFDPFAEYEDALFLKREKFRPALIEIPLFRKVFQFRQLDPIPLAFLQTVPRLMSYLNGVRLPFKTENAIGKLATRTLYAIMQGPETVTEKNIAPSFPWMLLDLDSDIRIFPELIEEGSSSTLIDKAKRK